MLTLPKLTQFGLVLCQALYLLNIIMVLDFKITDLGLWLEDNLQISDKKDVVTFDEIKAKVRVAFPSVGVDSYSFKRLVLKLLGGKWVKKTKAMKCLKWIQPRVLTINDVTEQFFTKPDDEGIKLMKSSSNGLSIVITVKDDILVDCHVSNTHAAQVPLPIACNTEAESVKMLRRIYRSHPCSDQVSPSCELLLSEFVDKETCGMCQVLRRKRRYDEKAQITAGM